MTRIVKNFFQGLIILVPMVATIYVLYVTFVKIDGILNISVPGVGFVLTVAFVTFIGFLASNFLAKRLFDYLEGIFTKVPLVKLLYSSIKDLIGAFVGERKTFDKPVVVRLAAGSDAKAIGFVTRESLEFLGLLDHVAVYLPQSYNFAGNLLVFPSDQVRPLNAKGSEVMTFVLSGGISGTSRSAADKGATEGYRQKDRAKKEVLVESQRT
jgi:uncharacterized membrane protein